MIVLLPLLDSQRSEKNDLTGTVSQWFRPYFAMKDAASCNLIGRCIRHQNLIRKRINTQRAFIVLIFVLD
jgi:hypothetical protein